MARPWISHGITGPVVLVFTDQIQRKPGGHIHNQQQQIFEGAGTYESNAWYPGLERRWTNAFTLLLAIALGIRFVAMALVPLAPEEAYYWMYSQHAELSYFDHPPMIAWAIRLGTLIFGHTELGVRMPGTLMMLGASWFLYHFGRTWFSKEAGLGAAVLLQVLPMFFGVGFVATMDAQLVFFWTVGLVGVTAALRDNRPWGWYLAGFALGMALLSKYTGIFLAVGAGLAVIVNPSWWRHLKTPHPYLAFLLAAALFSPVVIWNAQHDWASFRFQFMDRFNHKPFGFVTALEFIGLQFMIVTPVILWICVKLMAPLWHITRRALPPQSIIIMAFSLPLFLIMAQKSFKYGVHINWTVPAFLSLLPATVQWVVTRASFDPKRQAWLKAWSWTLLICVVLNIGMMASLLVIQPRKQLLAAFGAWKELATIVKVYETELQQSTGRRPLVVGEGKYRLTSALAFYLNRQDPQRDVAHFSTSQWIMEGRGLGYAYWLKRDDWEGTDCIFVSEGQDALSKTTNHFASVQLATNVCLPRVKGRHYQVAICRGLRLTQPRNDAQDPTP